MSSIEFVPLTVIEGGPAIHAPLPMPRGFCTDAAVGFGAVVLPMPQVRMVVGVEKQRVQLQLPRAFCTDAPQGFGAGLLPMPKISASAIAPPPIIVCALPLPMPFVRMTVVSSYSASISVPMPLPKAFGTDATGPVIMAQLQLPRVYATDRDFYAGGLLFALQTNGYVSMLAGHPMYSVASEFFASDALTMFLGLALNDGIVGTDSVSGGGAARRATIADTLSISDKIALISYIICASSTSAVLTLDALKYVLLTMVDAVLATDVLVSRRAALAAMADLLHALDNATPISFITTSDTANATVSVSAFRKIFADFMDGVAAEDTVNGLRTAFVTTNAVATGSDAVTEMRTALMAINDAMFLGGRFTFDGVPYTIYAVQPVGAAVSEYTNLTFNSYFTGPDGALYGVNETGVHKIEGANDETKPIRGSVYTGLTNFGNSLAMQVPHVYVYGTHSGRLLCKVKSVKSRDKKGTVKENWYELTTSPRVGVSSGRFDIGKGVQGNYFGFELTNVNGEDFDIDVAKAWVLQLSRRV